jgi:adenylosuccinate lyase
MEKTGPGQLKDSPISPIDDRYYAEARELSSFFSERALMDERIRVEIEYLWLLVSVGAAPDVKIPRIISSYEEVKRIESSVGHDVKAVELFIRQKIRKSKSAKLAPFVHLGLTSEDVNTLAYGRLLAGALRNVIIPQYEKLARRLAYIAAREAETVMLARTHGRPAVPTTFGKEAANFAVRLAERTRMLKSMRPAGKVAGAVGTYASFGLLKRSLDWPKVFGRFVTSMGLEFTEYNTQVPPYERYSDIFHVVIDVNLIMLNLAQDLWTYQALDYLRFLRPGKVSSSTMPQKVNPVDLENAEGQAEISNSLLLLLAYKPEVTRLQRDLSDSPVRRMAGQGLAHSLVACKRILSSLDSMSVRRDIMKGDLNEHGEVFGEPVQLLLRSKGDEKGYEKVRKAIENGTFSVPKEFSRRVGEYLGLAPALAKNCRKEVNRLLNAET